MKYEIIPLADERRWDGALAPFGGGDVYYRRGYLAALRRRGEGEPVLISAADDRFRACHIALVRGIGEDADPDAGGVDLVSPYGYAGPLLEPRDARAAAAFLDAWTRAASDLRAVCEFVRFHPVLETHVPFLGLFDIELTSQTVRMDLSAHDLESALSKTCRKNLKTAIRKDVRIRFSSRDESELSRFAALYRETMARRGARDYYVFKDEYFRELAEGLGDDLWIVLAEHGSRDVAGAAILRHGPYLHYHLGGSRFEQRSLCATNLLLYRVAERGRDEGFSVFHLGGGLATADTLFKFKAGFSPLRGKFYAGRRIYDRAAYERLSAGRRALGPINEKYFPAYRAPLAKNGEEE